jgi:hypothetical protein
VADAQLNGPWDGRRADWHAAQLAAVSIAAAGGTAPELADLVLDFSGGQTVLIDPAAGLELLRHLTTR